jgi:hypothetical protein
VKRLLSCWLHDQTHVYCRAGISQDSLYPNEMWPPRTAYVCVCSVRLCNGAFVSVLGICQLSLLNRHTDLTSRQNNSVPFLGYYVLHRKIATNRAIVFTQSCVIKSGTHNGNGTNRLDYILLLYQFATLLLFFRKVETLHDDYEFIIIT